MKVPNRTNKAKNVDLQSQPRPQLIGLIGRAIQVAKTAKRHKKSLSGTGFYADKMNDLRAEATNVLSQFHSKPGAADPELDAAIQLVFAGSTITKDRVRAAQELKFKVNTEWAVLPVDNAPLEECGVFPLATLTAARREYLVPVGRQANGCYAREWYDARAVMMRRLLESSIIEAFEAKKLDGKIKNPKTGDFFDLSALIDAALTENTWNLPRNVRKEIKNLRDLGHRSAHNRYYVARKSDIDRHSATYRETVEAFLHIASVK
jgi:hypothetical protein